MYWPQIRMVTRQPDWVQDLHRLQQEMERHIESGIAAR